jgi:hypothetical protein
MATLNPAASRMERKAMPATVVPCEPAIAMTRVDRDGEPARAWQVFAKADRLSATTT